MARLRSLDVLRAAAVLMVLVCHMRTPGGFFERLGGAMAMGVTLFFVLSGFLISALLYDEADKTGGISFVRFFVRRGFKIYPAFYVFLAATAAFRLMPFSDKRILAEAFFVQNHFPAVYGHTWTLAVEEQFYVLLPLLLIVLVRKKALRQVPRLCLAAGLLALAYRILDQAVRPVPHPPNHPLAACMDALFFGVFLSYVWRYHRAETERLMAKAGGLLWLGALFFLPRFLFSDITNPVMATAGLTATYLLAGLFLIKTVSLEGRFQGRLWDPLVCIGRHSYSIYLWHTVWMPPAQQNGFLRLGIAVVFGIFMAQLVEFPALALRERMPGPARNASPDRRLSET